MARRRQTNPGKQDVPIQPVDDPILSSPYEEPEYHWTYKQDTGEAMKAPGRREAGYYYKTPTQKTITVPPGAGADAGLFGFAPYIC